MSPGFVNGLTDTVLGTDSRMRLRLKRSLMALPVYIVSALLLAVAVRSGFADANAARWAAGFALVGPLSFYLLIRSSVSERLRDPSLTLPQMFYAIGAVMVGYAVAAPARSATLLLLALVMSFGAFRLTPRQAWTLCGVAVGSFAVMVSCLGVWFPRHLDLNTEAINFCVAAAVLPTLAALAAQTHRMSARLRQRRGELQLALHSVENLAMHDGLTGLVNRRRLQQLLDEALAREARGDEGLCVIMIDIDHFKQVNDRHGHAGGDWVLLRFAHLARSALRATDMLGRWGGEEFLLLLPATRSGEAQVLYERVAARLRDAANWSEHPERQITVSAGLAEYVVGDSAAELIARADARLYASKAGGRDRLVWD